MSTLLVKPRSILLSALLVAILACGAYAFTASNTVPASTAGSGSGAVSGYTAAGITYALTSGDPSTIDEIEFTLNPTSTSTVRVKAGTAGSWKICPNSSGTVTCDYSAAPISLSAIDNLTVVAVS